MKSFIQAIFGFVTLLILLTPLTKTYGCTTVIVSGKYTEDGRPLLFKQRDTGQLNNTLVQFNDGAFRYVGLMNADDSLGKNVWIGANDQGFAIMNSASYNLNINDTTSLEDQEGVVMKKALQSCASIADFERLLKSWAKPIGVSANFGVIDAQGGAAYYETGNFNFTKFDANDPSQAPFGYILRTNFSFSGNPEKGAGIIRFETADGLLKHAAATNQLSSRFLIKQVSRCLKQNLTERDLYQEMPAHAAPPKMVPFRDFIPRHSTAGAMVVQGIKKGEAPELTTLWTILGFPLSSIVVPVWINQEQSLPGILSPDAFGKAPLCQMALNLKKPLFPLKRGAKKDYLDLAKLINADETGVWQKLDILENEIMDFAEKNLINWRRSGIDKKKLSQFYNWIDLKVPAFYHKEFGLKLK